MTKLVNFNTIKGMQRGQKTSKMLWWAAKMFKLILSGPPRF